MKAVTIAGMLLVPAAAASAQQQVAGTYTWEMPTRIRNDGGAVSSNANAVVKLVLDVRGDSVFGTYTMTPPAGSDAPPPQAREVRGTLNGNKVLFSMAMQGRVNINGEERAINSTSTYTLTIDGDVITGTIDVQTPDMPMTVPIRTFTGKRVS
ncbi:MAG TPA: hypothetical protein VK928_06060 [Longimicrobiales bacterium]|nr:hypothetical protein [Longimicrobiales bacterium]